MSFIIVKEKDNNLPEKDFLNLCYKKFGSTVSFAYNFNEKICVNKNYNNFEYFCEDFYNEVLNKCSAIISFENSKEKTDDNFPLIISDTQSKKLFFKTSKDIIFCENNFKNNNTDILKHFIDFDFNNYSFLFNMISNYKKSIIIKCNGELIYLGNWKKRNNLVFSELIENIDSEREEMCNLFDYLHNVFDENKDNILRFNKNISSEYIKYKRCLYCEKDDNLDVVNNVVTLCNCCKERLNVFKCNKCNKLFTGIFFHYNNICSECFYNQPIINEVLYALHSVTFDFCNGHEKHNNIKKVKDFNYSQLSKRIIFEDTFLRINENIAYKKSLKNVFKKLELPVENI